MLSNTEQIAREKEKSRHSKGSTHRRNLKHYSRLEMYMPDTD